MNYELRDPIHKRISFNDFEKEIIDHPFFQRLRFISQLGFLQSYVYPGAVHDRFTHSLGAMHVAGRLFGKMILGSHSLKEKLSSEELESLRSRVRIAGLLHDIGHGPFSHASEEVFPKLSDLPFNWDWWKLPPPLTPPRAGGEFTRQAVHEDYSVLLIQTLAKEGLLEKDFAQDICSLIHRQIKPSSYFMSLIERIPGLQKVLKGLISGEVDCDRMDYLLRDSYYCGVAYGSYDLDWLISSISVAEREGELIFTLSENGVRAFEDILLARYHMIDQVYFHKTKAGFIHCLEQAIKQKEIDLQIPTDPYAYTNLRDGAVIELLFEAAKDEKNYWSHHLMHRIAAKRIIRLYDLKPEDKKTLDNLKGFCEKNNIQSFTHSVKNKLSFFSERSTEHAPMIYVSKKHVNKIEYIPIFEYSDLLQKYNEKLQFTDFFVKREDFGKFEKIKTEFNT